MVQSDQLWQFHGKPTVFIYFYVTTFHVNRSNMNYTVVYIGGTVTIFLIVNLAWVTWGRTRFVGSVHTNPVVENTKYAGKKA